MTIWSSSQGSAMGWSEEFRRDTVSRKRKPKIKLTTGIRVLLKSQRFTRSTSVRPAEHADLGHAGILRLGTKVSWSQILSRSLFESMRGLDLFCHRASRT